MPTAPRRFTLHPKPMQGGKSVAAYARARKYRTKAWEQIRLEILARDGMQCQLCGKLCTGKGEAHVDHIRAVVDGGTDEPQNLRCICASCHSRRTLRDNK